MRILFFLLFFTILSSTAQQLNVVPMPADVKMGTGYLTLKEPIGFIYNDDVEPGDGGVKQFQQLLTKQFGLKKFQSGDTHSYGLPTEIFIDFDNTESSEAYTLEIKPKAINIRGNANGIFYAFQTLSQMIIKEKGKAAKVPLGIIKDKPRFSYRGMHLDVGRHFFPVSYIKKYIDYLAEHKINTFHWHLTEDQGWRLQIKKYPKLTEIGSCRDQTLMGRFGSDIYDSTKYCGFYTQNQVKELVKYAADRYITVIPEIDMPGHSLAALASYPYLGCTKGPYKVMETWGVHPDILCAGNDSTYKFIEGVLDEVIALFPSKYIHIGGDEAPKDRWEKCTVCQNRIKAENLKDEHELQSYFIRRVEKYLNNKGRQIIGWDEILEGGLAPNATVMSWRGIKGGIAAAKLKHKAIMTPENPLYINHSQSRNEDSITQGQYNPLEAVYNYEPVPAELSEEEAKYIIGAQGNLWTEYINNTSKLEYMLFPRLSALSEVLWTDKSKRNWTEFERRLPVLFERYRQRNINFSNAYYDLQPSVIPADSGSIAWQLETKNTSGRIIYVKGKTTSASFDYTAPIVVNKTTTLGAALTDKNHRIISSWTWQDFNINKATGKKAQLKFTPSGNYVGRGAFTLLDGVQNTQWMVRSSQFLGFLGKNLDITIDLDSVQQVSEIILHAFEQMPSWIYTPASVAFYAGNDTTALNLLNSDIKATGRKSLVYKLNTNVQARFIRIVAKNYGKIPSGMPGAGNNAWLFVDEIEVN